MSQLTLKVAGIDLGTTHSAIAHLDAWGRPSLVPNLDGDRTTPSALLFADDEVVAGAIARRAALSQPERVALAVKRHLGDPEWTFPVEVDGEPLDAVTVSALLLRRLVEEANLATGEKITDAVIACPAYFMDAERRATIAAGRAAGLNVLGIVDEPAAAAFAWGIRHPDRSVRALVFDLGGGTLDASIVEIADASVRVIATDGIRHLGGQDWDAKIVEWVRAKLIRDHGVDPRDDPTALEDLVLRAVEAKRTLTRRPSAQIVCRVASGSARFDLNREVLRQLTAPLLDDIEDCLRRLVGNAGIGWRSVEVVLTVGGMTRLPDVRNVIQRVTGRVPDAGLLPDEAVAVGATYWAARRLLDSDPAAARRAVPAGLAEELADLSIRTVSAHALGVVTVDEDDDFRNMIMIPAQTTLPAENTQLFPLPADQDSVEISVLQGEEPDPEDCTEIGTCVISGLGERDDDSNVAVTYRYTRDGRIEITAAEGSTGREAKAEIVRDLDLDEGEVDAIRDLVERLATTGPGGVGAILPEPKKVPVRIEPAPAPAAEDLEGFQGPGGTQVLRAVGPSDDEEPGERGGPSDAPETEAAGEAEAEAEIGGSDDVALARRALEQGRLDQAAFHVAWAVHADPKDEDRLDLLDALIEAADDPLDLFDDDADADYATLACRAFVLASRERVADALALLFRVLLAQPDSPYLPWATWWLPRPSAKDLDPSIVSGFVATWCDTVEDPARLGAVLPVIEQTRALHPDDGILSLLHGRLLRDLGELEEALCVAQQAHDRQASWETAVALGTAHRALGQIDEALAAFQDAIDRDPEDISARLDMADMLCEAGRIGESRPLYEGVLDREPDHPWALPSFYFVNCFVDDDPKWHGKLERLARRSPDNGRAVYLAGRRTPYVGFLPEPRDATVNLLERLMEEREDDPDAHLPDPIRVRFLEAPSVRLAMQMLGEDPRVEVARVPTPDPREPRVKVPYVLWRYEGTDPTPAVARPLEDVAFAVATVAAQPYRLEQWWEAAAGVARDLAIGQNESLLGVMVHPPQPIGGMPPWTWIHRVQVAAALVIARLDTGWERSARREALLALAHGPMDWTVEAALIALTQVALEDVDARAEVLQLFAELFQALPEVGFCSYAHGLVCNFLRLPDLSKAWRARLEERRAELETPVIDEVDEELEPLGS